MKITSIQGREIFNCNGIPTLECQVVLDHSVPVVASVPSGLSKGCYEALELRDGGERLNGLGVQQAIHKIESIIAPAFAHREPNIIEMDQYMIELDGTNNKGSLGANTMLAVSIAILRAQALAEQYELYEFIAQICGSSTVTLPFPLFVMISGGLHARNKLRIQEFLILPIGSKNFREAMEHGTLFFRQLEKKLKKAGLGTLKTDEGSFAPLFEDDMQALTFLTEIIEQLSGEYQFKIALDVAASHFFNSATRLYEWSDKQYNTNELLAFYAKLVDTFPICSLEDPLSEDDWEGWVALMQLLGEEIQILGDDLFVTNPSRIIHGVEIQAANAVIIKPNQIGTVTETLQAIQVCQQNGLNVAIAHRSGETNDTFIADLAVGVSAEQVKAGSCSGGERLAKYNRILAIEEELTSSLRVTI